MVFITNSQTLIQNQQFSFKQYPFYPGLLFGFISFQSALILILVIYLRHPIFRQMKWFVPGAPAGWWQSPEESSSLTSTLLLELVLHSHPSTRRDIHQCSQNSSNITIFILRIENWPDNSISADKCWHYLELNILWKDSAADRHLQP